MHLNQSLEHTGFCLKQEIFLGEYSKPRKAQVYLKPREGQFGFQNMLFPASCSGFKNVLTCYVHLHILTNIQKAHFKRAVQFKGIHFILSSKAKLQEYKTHMVQTVRYDFPVISLKTLQANTYS